MSKKEIPGIGPYGGAAGGWGALQSVARIVRNQMSVKNEARILLRVNQQQGFDCPGCAWPDPLQASSFEFCENGAKAVAWEATSKRVTAEFFATHTLSELWEWDDHALEDAGRLSMPMAYDATRDRYLPISWDAAFAIIGKALSSLPDANMAEFYTSGRTSNEAAFLYQLFVREFGTNNFPDCSNLCHEATSVGLPQSIGVGKATVTLEDFDHCDAIFCIGHNPGTNHPRMLSTLREASRRGAPIVVFNPLRERGLERFVSPQNAIDMATGRATKLATQYYQLKIGGDSAALYGIMKSLFERDTEAISQGRAAIVDHTFIAEHTTGFEALRDATVAMSWIDIEAAAGLSRAQLDEAAEIYANAKNVILCYGMGVTQHSDGTGNVQQLVNLLLLRGNIGREGAGICPLRGHSNVQGDRTVGITEIPSQQFLDGIERTFGFAPPREHGHGAVASIEAIRDQRSRALICMGGNLAVAMSDTNATFAALQTLDLAVHIATKLNRSHLIKAKQLLLLPCLGRTERDMQAGGEQAVTVEDSVSKVHVSRGTLEPASPDLRSECAIVAGIAKATLPDTRVDWDAMVGDYRKIRDAIAAVLPEFADFNQRLMDGGGFHLYNAARHREWKTASGKANFLVNALPPTAIGGDVLQLATIRSHDQYNTTIYGKDDRYRGVTGRRDVLFMNETDLAARGLSHGDVVDLQTHLAEDTSGVGYVMRGLTAVAFDIPAGCVAAYYPETNVMIPLSYYDARSGTPSFKSIPVLVHAASAHLSPA